MRHLALLLCAALVACSDDERRVSAELVAEAPFCALYRTGDRGRTVYFTVGSLCGGGLVVTGEGGQ